MSDTFGVNNVGAGAGQIGVSGSTVTYSGTTIGTITSNTSNGITITFVSNVLSAAVQALDRSNQFQHFQHRQQQPHVAVHGYAIRRKCEYGDADDRRQAPGLQTDVWVDSNWVVTNDVAPSGLSFGDTVRSPDSSVTGKILGVNASSTIQDGVNDTAAGGTTHVDNGIYPESNITLLLPITVEGQSMAGVVMAPSASASNVFTAAVREPRLARLRSKALLMPGFTSILAWTATSTTLRSTGAFLAWWSIPMAS